MKLLVTGLTGLVGSRFSELLETSYELENLSSSTGTDILDRQAVFEKVSTSNPDLVIHFAAKTNVDSCEEDKEKDKEAKDSGDFTEIINNKSAWAVNVLGTKNLIDACKEKNKKIIYISTDFVFDGTKKSYDEESNPDPINWYAKTKYEGELLIQKSDLDYQIVRIAYPYRAIFDKKDFVRAVLDKLSKNEKLNMVTDHIMVPTFIDDIVNGLNILIQKNEKGIFHVVGSESITPYQAAFTIARIFDLDDTQISKTTRREYFKGKAPRPFCLNLKNDKIGRLGIEMSTFEKGIIEIKIQMEKMHI